MNRLLVPDNKITKVTLIQEGGSIERKIRDGETLILTEKECKRLIGLRVKA